MSDNLSLKQSRVLLCPAHGIVAAVGELGDGYYSRGACGSGFAVFRTGGLRGFLNRFSPRINVCSPADGVITAINDEMKGFSLRTGDGVELSVVTAAPAVFLSDVGQKVTAGQPVCGFLRQEAQNSDTGGSAVVLFTRTSQITELHVRAGIRRAGERAASYKLNFN